MRKLHMPYIEITHAALRLYAAQGPGGLTMRALGKSLGVCASALYRHFKNKDAIVESLVDAAEKRLAFRLRPSARLKPPKDRAGFMAERALRFSLEQPHLFQLIARRKASWRTPYDDGERASLMRDQLGRAMNEKQLKKGDVGGVTATLWALICGLVALKERGDLPAEEPRLRDSWLGTSRRMLDGLALRAA